MAANPAPCSLHRPDGSGPDGFVAEETLEILRQLQGAAVALTGFLAEAFKADGLQIPRHVGLEAGHGHRLVVEHLQNRSRVASPP